MVSYHIFDVGPGIELATFKLQKVALALLFDVDVGTGIELATFEFHIQRSTHWVTEGRTGLHCYQSQ